jgi:hypothetical protein
MRREAILLLAFLASEIQFRKERPDRLILQTA